MIVKIAHNVALVPKSSLNEHIHFIRDDIDSGDLLHICKVSDDWPNEDHYPGNVFVKFAPIRFDYTLGYYYCSQCKQTFSSQNELSLIWEDGEGTGWEGNA